MDFAECYLISLLGDFRTEDSSASMEAMMGFSGFGECTTQEVETSQQYM